MWQTVWNFCSFIFFLNLRVSLKVEVLKQQSVTSGRVNDETAGNVKTECTVNIVVHYCTYYLTLYLVRRLPILQRLHRLYSNGSVLHYAVHQSSRSTAVTRLFVTDQCFFYSFSTNRADPSKLCYPGLVEDSLTVYCQYHHKSWKEKVGLGLLG